MIQGKTRGITIMPRKSTTWIVIADGARARFLAHEGHGTGVTPTGPREMADLQSHLRTTDLGTDKPGRSFGDHSGARSAMEPRVDWHRQRKEQFAKDVAAAIDHGASTGAFDRLILVAPPATLGVMRQALGAAASGRLHGELAKDLTKVADDELAAHLAGLVSL
jgi:protein required for attachment to host cells